MLLIFHILIALSSIVMSGLTYVHPSRKLLHTSYALVGATLVTGTALVLISPTHLASACVSGLAYLAVVGAATVATRLKLARQSNL